MTWECEHENCGHVTEYLLEMFDHYFKKHPNYPKNTEILCREHRQEQTKLFEVSA